MGGSLLMSHGLIVSNTAGNVVIDGNYRNLHLQEKKVFYLASGGEYRVSTAAIGAVIFLGVTGGFAGVIEQAAAGNSWLVRAASNCTVSAYIFAPGSPEKAAWGMEVYDESRGLVFSSAASALRILDFNLLPFSSRYNTDRRPSFQKAYGVAVAACVGIPRLGFDGHNTGALRTDAINTDGGVLTVTNTLVKSVQGPWSTHTGLLFDAGNVPLLTASVSGT